VPDGSNELAIFLSVGVGFIEREESARRHAIILTKDYFSLFCSHLSGHSIVMQFDRQ
jgi:hypothetical protein